MKTFDVIIIGAGSVGLPLAWRLSKEKVKVLVLEKNASAGQGQNKAAIGGVRATHSDPAKIKVCLKSLEIFSAWQDTYGDDIGWQKGGYSFPAYEEETEKTLKNLLTIQKKYRLNIDWLNAAALKEALPGINPKGLRGGTLSPDDGNISPLLTAHAFHRQAKAQGSQFHFNEQVTSVNTISASTREIITTRGKYQSSIVIIAAGAEAKEVGTFFRINVPLEPDSHEGGITEPVKHFFSPLVVDLRERPGSKNFYFYQNKEGQIVFCITPHPIIPGTNKNATSSFLPMVSRRLMEVMPRLRNIKIRRTWRGLYPMTPDGVPIVDTVQGKEGIYLAVGMCGQGLMLGPGLAENLTSLILNNRPQIEPEIFCAFSLCRKFSCVELLK